MKIPMGKNRGLVSVRRRLLDIFSVAGMWRVIFGVWVNPIGILEGEGIFQLVFFFFFFRAFLGERSTRGLLGRRGRVGMGVCR